MTRIVFCQQRTSKKDLAETKYFDVLFSSKNFSNHLIEEALFQMEESYIRDERIQIQHKSNQKSNLKRYKNCIQASKA